MRLLQLTLLTALAAQLLALPASVQASSPRVAALQVALKSKHLYKGKIDGISGPMTRRGVVVFQRRNNIKVDGKAGLRTRRALGWRGRPSIGSRAMRRGHRGFDVAALQFLLQRAGFGAGRTDGIFGPLTRQAVLRAQRAAGIKPDGVAGLKTVAFLRRGGAAEDGSSGPVLVNHNSENGAINFTRPVVGPIGDRFGASREGGKRRHLGLDFPVPQGTKVVAAAAGTTIFAGWNSGGYGNLVVVQHAQGYTTWYAHLSRITSWVGEEVSAGSRVGLVGSTGYSTGPHLHFEIRHYGTHLNPLPLITPEATMARASAYAATALPDGSHVETNAPSAQGGHSNAHAHDGGHGSHCKAPARRGGARGNWIAQESLCG